MTDLSPALTLEVQRVVAAEQQRQADIAKAWRYYDGDAPQPLVIVRPQNKLPIDDNVRVNFSRLLVNTGVHYLFGQPLGINFPQIGTGEQKRDDPIGDWLGEALPMMGRMTLLQKAASNGGIAGHTMLRILLPEPGERYPRVIVLDPSMVRATWDPRDIDRVLRWSINFIAEDPVTKKPKQYQTLIEPVGEPKRPSAWTIIDSEGEPGTALEETESFTWPYPFSPIVHCQNLPRANEFYGAPDLESDLLDLQSDIDKVLSNGNKITRNWAKPPTFARGLQPTQLADLTANPDGINLLPGDKETSDIFSLKSEADMKALIEFEKLLVDHLREIAHLPEAASGKASGTISSLTLKLLFAPVVQMTEAKHNTYGQMLTDLVRRLIVVGKQANRIEDVPTPDLHWDPIVPNDDATEIARDTADLELGFSKATLIERRGGDPETEAAKREEESRNAGEALLTAMDRGEEPEL